MRWFLSCHLACLAAFHAGCAAHSGMARIEAMIAARPAEPFARVVFKAQPAAGERPLAEIQASLSYWEGPGADGKPRWQDVLAPHPEDLYARILRAIDRGEPGVELVSYKYDACGLEALTLVDYFDARGAYLGFDHVAYGTLPEGTGGGAFSGYDDMAWWEYPQLLLDIPVFAAIGLKELAGEIVKAPLSAIDVGPLGTAVGGFSPASPLALRRAAGAFAEDWRNGFCALAFRFRARARHTPLDLVRELAGAIPLIGPALDYAPGPERAPREGTGGALALSQGIHAGNDREQHLTAWVQAMSEILPRRRAIGVSYRYGGFLDTIWSIANLSNGMAYDAAERLVFEHGVGPGDGLELVGFSGGVQRFTATSRILRDVGIAVDRLVGIAGPTTPFARADRARVLLGTSIGDDPVLLTAHLVRALFFIFPNPIAFIPVNGAGTHATPFFPDGATRAPARGYATPLAAILGR